METRLWSKTKEVIISEKGPTILVGERINPTGKQDLSAALRQGNMRLIRKEAITQLRAGADILDINIGVADIDEVDVLPKVVQTIMDTVDAPICLDSNNPKALESALKIYQGKPLMNSVSGEERSLETILPLVKAYGAAVIGLVVDDKGIPDNPDKRVAIAWKIVDRAVNLGIPREDVVIDCLVQSVGADEKAALIAIETIKKVRAELGLNITVGASNVSFGLPDRNIINNAFLSIAIASGATCAIADVAKVRPIVLATDLLMGRDKFAKRYIQAYKERVKQ